MFPWSELAVHVVGFAAYAGALIWAQRLSRPVEDPDRDELARFARAARLPIWALLAAIALMVYAALSRDLIAASVWAINCGVAALFMRAMRRVWVLERSRYNTHRQTRELMHRIQQVHDKREPGHYSVDN